MKDADHYTETLGHVPAAIAALYDLDEVIGTAHTDVRKLIYQTRPDGLSLAVKELFLVALDIAAGNKSGALNHLSAAKRAGATDSQVREILLSIYLVFGVSAWGTVGQHVWTAWKGEPVV